MAAARTRLLFFILIVAGGFTLRAPLAVSRLHLTPDSIIYANIARNLASGRGYVSSIKLHYIDDRGILHPALPDCPPVYPLFAALIFRLGGGIRALVLANVLLTSLAAGLVFLTGERLFGTREGLLAGTAAVLAPNLLRAGITAMSDPLALVLILCAILTVLKSKPGPVAFLLAGTLSALAILTRYPSWVIAVAVLCYTLRGKMAAKAALYVTGLLPAIVFPLAAGPSIQSLHYSVGSFNKAMWNLGAPVDRLYGVHHASFVLATFARNLVSYAQDLLTGLRGLFIISVGIPLWLIMKRKPFATPEQKLALQIGVMNLVIYAATWSLPPVRGSRFLLLSFCLLLPFCAAGLVHVWDKWKRTGKLGVAAVCSVAAIAYLWGCAATLPYTAGDCRLLAGRDADAVRSALAPGAAIASNNPWVLGYSTGLPTGLLPRNLDADALKHFVTRYHIEGIVVLTGGKPSLTSKSVAATCWAKIERRGLTLYSTARTHTKADGM